MTIFLAADHAGLALKDKVRAWLKGLGYDVADEGAFELDEKDDYPDFMSIVAKQVASDPSEHRGIIFGGSGQGEAMTANRYPGVRAAVYYGGAEKIITLSREHNDANVLAVGARFVDEAEAIKMVKLWLETKFTGEERHRRRIAKVDNLIEKEYEF